MNVEDPDTPPVTPDVEAMREIYRDVIDVRFSIFLIKIILRIKHCFVIVGTAVRL